MIPRHGRGLTRFCARRAHFFLPPGEALSAPHNRGASAEAQCGTAPRAARDLTGEPCSPVSPFFLDGVGWVNLLALTQSGGVQGPFRASCRTVSIDAPGAFSLGPLQRPVLFSREKRMGGWEHFPLGKKRLRPPGAKSSVAALCAEPPSPVGASPAPRRARNCSILRKMPRFALLRRAQNLAILVPVCL